MNTACALPDGGLRVRTDVLLDNPKIIAHAGTGVKFMNTRGRFFCYHSEYKGTVLLYSFRPARYRKSASSDVPIVPSGIATPKLSQIVAPMHPKFSCSGSAAAEASGM